jgi:hypothetical protein
MVDIVKLSQLGEAAFQQLHTEPRGDRLDLVGTEPLEAPVHGLSPGPEAVLARAPPLGAADEGSLECVAVQVGHAGDHGPRQADIFGLRRSGLDRADVAVCVDPEPDVGGPARS